MRPLPQPGQYCSVGDDQLQRGGRSCDRDAAGNHGRPDAALARRSDLWRVYERLFSETGPGGQAGAMDHRRRAAAGGGARQSRCRSAHLHTAGPDRRPGGSATVQTFGGGDGDTGSRRGSHHHHRLFSGCPAGGKSQCDQRDRRADHHLARRDSRQRADGARVGRRGRDSNPARLTRTDASGVVGDQTVRDQGAGTAGPGRIGHPSASAQCGFGSLRT